VNESEPEYARCESHDALPARRVVVLGSTGSIGRQALEVIGATPSMGLVALVADTNVDAVLGQAQRLGVGRVGFHDVGAAAEAAARRSPCRVYAGDTGVAELIAEAAAEAANAGGSLTVLNGIVGAAGLRATLATLPAGATLALANKESMVAGGDFVLAAARASGARIIPVDSEHSAIFQCLGAGRSVGGGDAGGEGAAAPLLAAEEILLTGSGGPFRGRTRDELARVTPDEALHHPNWVMGAKVTIDSATLMNKGLEVIEAHYLFGVPYEQIRVVVHPQSIVHSMVRFADGALLAHLGVPDMRTPIGYALSYPERAPLPMVMALDLLASELTFSEPDTATFRCLALAREAGERAAQAAAAGRPIAAPIVLNAANEVAVHAFLGGTVGFLDIEAIVAAALDKLGDAAIAGLDDVFAADAEARGFADTLVRQGSRT
jgi:1-deoxy-D-xylulose-5-phosphate reductoisomerase